MLRNGYDPEKPCQVKEDLNESKYLKEWKKFSFKNNISYRTTQIDGQQTSQLVLPVHYRSIVLKLLHDDSGHKGRDRTISLVLSRFFWPGLDSDVEKKVKTCDSVL